MLWAIAIVVVVASIVGVGWWLQRDDRMSSVSISATQPANVAPDHDYYFFVRLVEFNPKTPKGKSWDSVDGSAPDAEIVLYWRGNKTFSWADRTDQLINTWDLFRVNVADLITSGGKIDIASAVNAPMLNIKTGESVTLEIWDNDPAFSDLALKMEIDLSQLRIGRNKITPPVDSGVNRVEIDMIDRDTPLAKLIELQSNGG